MSGTEQAGVGGASVFWLVFGGTKQRANPDPTNSLTHPGTRTQDWTQVQHTQHGDHKARWKDGGGRDGGRRARGLADGRSQAGQAGHLAQGGVVGGAAHRVQGRGHRSTQPLAPRDTTPEGPTQGRDWTLNGVQPMPEQSRGRGCRRAAVPSPGQGNGGRGRAQGHTLPQPKNPSPPLAGPSSQRDGLLLNAQPPPYYHMAKQCAHTCSAQAAAARAPSHATSRTRRTG